MRKSWIVGLAIVLFISLIGCAAGGANNGNGKGNEVGNAEWYEDLNFGVFTLNADYEDGKYAVEYLYNEGSPTAEIVDTRGDKEEIKEGQEALDELEDKLTELELTNESTEEEIITEVVNVFELEEDYEELKVEIEFLEKKVEVED